MKSSTCETLSLLDMGRDDFPLICTYEQFLFLLGHAIETLDWAASQQTTTRHRKLTLVDFKAFRTSFWPHFPHHLTKGLSPDLVFSEIMGVIKGSIHTCKSLSFLDLSLYGDLSFRLTPNLSRHEDRIKIFHLYQAYEELKRKTGDIDTIDLVVGLLRQLHESPSLMALLAPYIQEVYVDEVQDQRCLDISLLLTIVQNPLGLHLGGDTAQAISQDSVFRFQDVKALFHDRFSREGISVAHQRLAEPRMFTLNRNYRSHQGILSVASSVMEMLWRTFPDTIDKLEPEVGTMVGPTPILFQNCGSSILMRQERETTATMDFELLFGAEQVIIARDNDSKAELVKQIGEVALILTVLQSKGMEFDDVIIWNFFSNTPDAVGWRSLSDFMHGKVPFFDTAKHVVLCSELKNLYVAITRARLRVLFVERSEDAAQPFVKLVNKGSTLALLEVTSPGAVHFDEKIKSLQPRRSDDPRRWLANGEDMMRRGHFADASLCFRGAHNPLKEKEANAHLQEERGVELQVKGKSSESQTEFKRAAAHFQELGMISDASRVLIRGDLFDDAAKLLYNNKNFEDAAVLYEKTRNYERASESWHARCHFNKAAMALRRGHMYDMMIQYLVKHEPYLNEEDWSQHKSAVKLLLKRKQISKAHREAANRILGSFAEQESFFKEYGITDDLLALYRQQAPTAKLFNLLLELGNIEEAFSLVPSLERDDREYPDDDLLNHVEALVWVDRINSHSENALKSSPVGGKIDSWQSAYRILHSDADYATLQGQILSMEEHSVMKAFLCLYVTIRYRLAAMMYDKIPFGLLSHTIKSIKILPFDFRSFVGQAVLLLCGVYQTFDAQRSYNARAWAPPIITAHSISSARSLSMPEAALRWTLDNVTDAIIQSQYTTRSLYDIKWPNRCSVFLVTGRCNIADQIHRMSTLHEPVSSNTYTSRLEDLLRVNTMFCEMTALYERHAMSEQSSKVFLGHRRYWLEKLIGELTFTSSFEQDSQVIMRVTENLGHDGSLTSVTAALEANLIYKARKEWEVKTTLGDVLEQLNCVNQLGYNVKEQLVRKTRAQLRNNRPSAHAAMVLLDALQTGLRSGDAVLFRDALQRYTLNLLALETQDYRVFHCHTAIFEAIALFLLLQMSQSSIAVPRSWLDLHLADILKENVISATLDSEQRFAYRDALLLLITTFIELLQKLNGPLQADASFHSHGCGYPSRILQQRNAELLAIIIVNLSAIRDLRPLDFNKYSQAANKAFQLHTVRAWHLEHGLGKTYDLRVKLLGSLSRYQGKNPLTILNIADAHPHPFKKFQELHKLQIVNLTALRNNSHSISPSDKSAVSDAEKSVREEKAVVCIQRRWRHHGPGLIARHRARATFADTNVGRAIVRLRVLGKELELKTRYRLVYYGVECLVRSDRLTADISSIRKAAIKRLDSATFEQSKALENVLEMARKLDDSLKGHQNQLSDQALGSLVRMNNDTALKELLMNENSQMAKEEAEVKDLSNLLNGMS